IDRVGSPGVTTLASFDGSHVFADNGVYTVTVTASDDDGLSDQKTFHVTVNNVNPTLAVVGNQGGIVNRPVSITDIGKISDPWFDNPNTPNGASREQSTYSINWGDPTPARPGSAPIDRVGSPGVTTLASFDGSHTYTHAGIFTVTVTIHDDDGGSDQKTFQI